MTTKKRPNKHAELLASSRAAIEFTGIEMAEALQTDGPGYVFPWLSRHLLEHPEILDPLGSSWKKIILRIVAAHAADYPLPKLPTWDIAFLVDQEILFGRSPAEARAGVMKDTGASKRAVEQAHAKYGKHGLREASLKQRK